MRRSGKLENSRKGNRNKKKKKKRKGEKEIYENDL